MEEYKVEEEEQERERKKDSLRRRALITDWAVHMKQGGEIWIMGQSRSGNIAY